MPPFQAVGLSSLNRLNEAILIYPNPAGDAIYIKPLTALAPNSSCHIEDCTGKRRSGMITFNGTAATRIPASGLANGMYILVFQQEGSRYYRKVIVLH